MRADALRNRECILDAAREVFAVQGIDAPLTTVAARAGVGVATLFRRFPTREDLVTATFSERIGEYARAAYTASRDPDPWRGFCSLVQEAAALQSGDLGFTEVLTRSFPGFRTFEAERIRAFSMFADLVVRAKAAGALREDFAPEDFPVLLMAHAGVVTATAGAAPTAGPRLVAYLLQAYAAPARGPLPEPPTPRQITRALARMQVRAQRSATTERP
jgi:AcrR family transcriptional regulator